MLALASTILVNLSAAGVVVVAVQQVNGDPLPNLVQYGILGLLVLLLMTGKFVVPRFVLDEANKRAEFFQGEVLRLHTVNEERTVPALQTAAGTQTEMIAFLRDM